MQRSQWLQLKGRSSLPPAEQQRRWLQFLATQVATGRSQSAPAAAGPRRAVPAARGGRGGGRGGGRAARQPRANNQGARNGGGSSNVPNTTGRITARSGHQIVRYRIEWDITVAHATTTRRIDAVTQLAVLRQQYATARLVGLEVSLERVAMSGASNWRLVYGVFSPDEGQTEPAAIRSASASGVVPVVAAVTEQTRFVQIRNAARASGLDLSTERSGTVRLPLRAALWAGVQATRVSTQVEDDFVAYRVINQLVFEVSGQAV